MEKKNKRGAVVGIFVFIALVIFVLGVMILGGQQSMFNKGATIHAVFDEISGLQSGNNVRYAGVKVGTVKEITFTQDGKVKVAMNIERESLPVIKADAKAKVGADGFIGNKIVVLYGGSPTASIVQDGSMVQTEPALSTEEMMETLQENNKNILVITNNFKTISDRLINGQGAAGKLLNDEQLYRDLQISMASLKQTVMNAQGMMANVTAYTNRLTAKGSLANDLITDTVIFSRLRNTAREMEALSDAASQVLDNLQTTSQSLHKSLNDSTTTAGLLLNDKATAADIRATIKNLQAGTQKLDENMEALQHSFLLRGYFKKKGSQ